MTGQRLKKFLVRLRDVALDACDGLLSVAPAGRGARGGVLLCRLDRLGDYVVGLDAARFVAKRARRNGERAVLLANQEWASLAEREPLFDEVWPVDVRRFRNDFGYRFSMLRRVRRAGFRAVYQLRTAPEQGLDDAIARTSGAPERYGAVGVLENLTPRAERRAARWYTRRVSIDPRVQHERDRNAQFAAGLGIGEYAPSIARPAMAPLAQRTIDLLPTGPYSVVVGGSGWEGRRWPSDRFAAVIDHLWRKHGIRSVLTGGPAERALGTAIVEMMTEPDAAIDLIGRVPLSELAGIVADARLVVANETGPVQLAVAVGTPAVCVVGGGHFGRFVPDPRARDEHGRSLLVALHHQMPCFGCGWHCTFVDGARQTTPCVEGVTVDLVTAAIDQLLDGVRRPIQERAQSGGASE